jgi:outer membrane protein
MKHILIAALFLLGYAACHAQIDTLKQQSQTPPSSVKWSLKQCVDYALAHSLTVQRSNYNVETSEVDLRQAKFSRLPSINGGVGYGYSWGRGLDPVTNNFTSQQIRSSSISGNASMHKLRLLLQNTTLQRQKMILF